MENFEKDFYAQIGYMSVLYAKMEYKLCFILGKLFKPEDELIANTIIEDNNLSKNIDLLKKTNRIVCVAESQIAFLIKQINEIKRNRNLYIHGLWHKPEVYNSYITCLIDERRISYEEKVSDDNYIDKIWKLNSVTEIKLSDIKLQIEKIEAIIEHQEQIIQIITNQDGSN